MEERLNDAYFDRSKSKKRVKKKPSSLFVSQKNELEQCIVYPCNVLLITSVDLGNSTGQQKKALNKKNQKKKNNVNINTNNYKWNRSRKIIIYFRPNYGETKMRFS